MPSYKMNKEAMLPLIIKHLLMPCLQFCSRNISKMALIGLKWNLKTTKIALIFLKRYSVSVPTLTFSL